MGKKQQGRHSAGQLGARDLGFPPISVRTRAVCVADVRVLAGVRRAVVMDTGVNISSREALVVSDVVVAMAVVDWLTRRGHVTAGFRPAVLKAATTAALLVAAVARCRDVIGDVISDVIGSRRRRARLCACV